MFQRKLYLTNRIYSKYFGGAIQVITDDRFMKGLYMVRHYPIRMDDTVAWSEPIYHFSTRNRKEAKHLHKFTIETYGKI